MRLSALYLPVLLCLGSCASSDNSTSPYGKPNELMGQEIQSRIDQIPFQHRDELLSNLLWLAQTGEPAIPGLITGLDHEDAKVRSSSAWVLGRIGDRRTIENLKQRANDKNDTVRLEVCRSLVLMGDLTYSPTLVEGLDSDRKEVRYFCHEALKTATGHDFGYDHLSLDMAARQTSVYKWRSWWGEYSGDKWFASAYAQEKGIDPENLEGKTPEGQPAVPMGEMMPDPQDPQTPPTGEPGQVPDPQGQQGKTGETGKTGEEAMPPAVQPVPIPTVETVPTGTGTETKPKTGTPEKRDW